MKRTKTFDYYFQEIGAGSAWVIFDITCPYCCKEKHIETVDYWNNETKQKCDCCGKKFLIILK